MHTRQPTLDSVVQNKQARRDFFRRNLPLMFEGVDGDTCDAIADSAHHVSRAPGEVLIHQGDTTRDVFIILCGLITGSRLTRENITYHLPYRGPGHPTGTNAMASEDRSSYTVTVVMPCDLFKLDNAEFAKAFNASRELRRNVIRYTKNRFYFVA